MLDRAKASPLTPGGVKEVFENFIATEGLHHLPRSHVDVPRRQTAMAAGDRRDHLPEGACMLSQERCRQAQDQEPFRVHFTLWNRTEA